ncbi:hypothetical protein, conserved [Leishmania tarentolae]|uniref:Uncharacterized protein n=1 Tax=Leishmania tarentolae TaxID=5689 RepID=A0A640K987_LEITA|nr:hypothetical protein, conserved [Leishmania tarentolae]
MERVAPAPCSCATIPAAFLPFMCTLVSPFHCYTLLIFRFGASSSDAFFFFYIGRFVKRATACTPLRIFLSSARTHASARTHTLITEREQVGAPPRTRSATSARYIVPFKHIYSEVAPPPSPSLQTRGGLWDSRTSSPPVWPRLSPSPPPCPCPCPSFFFCNPVRKVMYSFHKRADAPTRVEGDAHAQGATDSLNYERPSAGPQATPEQSGREAQQQGLTYERSAESGVGDYADRLGALVAGSGEGYGDYGQEDPSGYDMASYPGQGSGHQEQQQAYMQPQVYGQGGEAQGEGEDDAPMFADYRGPIDGERAERYNRRLQQQKQYDDIPMPADDADPREVFAYYRKLIGLVHFVPPRHWREIRFDLPANVAELRLYPQRRERVQDREPIRPTSCIAISLKGMLPENTTPSEYAAQMVQYMFDLLNYQNASTAITELRFVKKGTELLQMVVTLGKDTRLAGRVLTELQAAGLRAHYGKPVFEFPPNATFQVIDYRRTLHEGKGISAEDVTFLLEPIRQYNTVDINVIEGYEPGVFYAPVKRPETVYSFLWNYFCSYKFQSDLFRRYGVLVTMAQCPHEFLQKGIPYHIQKQQLEEKMRAELQRKGMEKRDYDGNGGGGGVGGDEDDDSDDGVNGGADEATGEGPPPAWAANAAEEIDIFSSSTPANHVQQQPISAAASDPLGYGSGSSRAAATAAAAANAKTVATAITFVDEDGLEDVDALLHQYNAITEPPPSAGKKKEAAAKGPKGRETTAAAGDGDAVGGGGVALPDTNLQGGAYILPPPPMEGAGWGGGHGGYDGDPYGGPPEYAPEHGAHGYPPPPQYSPSSGPYGAYQSVAPLSRATPYPSVAQRSSSSYAAPPYAYRDRAAMSASADASSAAAASGGSGAPSVYPLLVDEADDEQGVMEPPLPQEQQQQPSSMWAGDDRDGGYGDLGGQQQQQLPSASHAMAPAPHEKDMLLSWSMDEGMAHGTGSGYAAIGVFPPPPPHHSQQGHGNAFRQEAEEVSGLQSYGSNWPAFSDAPQQQLNPYETGAGVGGVLGDYDPPLPSYYADGDGSSYPPPPPHTAAPWSYADSNSGPPMRYSDPMPIAMPPHVREAAEITADLEERVQAAFPATWATACDASAQPFLLDGEVLEGQDLQINSEDSNCVLDDIPDAAAAAVLDLPTPTTEIEELLSFLQRNISLVGRLLHKTTTTTVEQAAEVAVFRARVARALLIGATMTVGQSESPASPEAIRAAWERTGADGGAVPSTPAVANDVEAGEPVEAEEAAAETQLPALLPYLLRTSAGVDLAMLLAFHYPRAFSRRFLPYAPAYLFEENIVRVVIATALRRDVQAANVLVRHVLAHWCPLAQWLLRVAHLKAAAKHDDGEARAAVATVVASGSATTAMTHLVSSIGCSMDTLLAALSPAQQDVCRAISGACNYVDAFAEAMHATGVHDQAEEDGGGGGGGGALPLLWGPDGALYRSLVRLYVNTDVCDGAAVALRMLCCGQLSSAATTPSLASAEVRLTRDHYYYCIVLLSRSHTAPVLSRETAAFCGAFLKLLELQHTRWQQQQQQQQERLVTDGVKHAARAPSVGEKEAEQLLEAAFKAMKTIDVYTALRDAYLAVEVPITRFESVLARLSPAEPSTELQLQVPTLTEWFDGSIGNSARGKSSTAHPSRKRGSEAPIIPSIFYYRAPPRRNARWNQPQQQEQPQQQQASRTTLNAPGTGGGNGHTSIASRWRQEWTATMRTYPPSGIPFPTLPEGWTSQPSCEFGHYCFTHPAPASSTNDATASATVTTYKHPVDGKEYPVTPQALLLQEAASGANTSGATLDQVRARANAMHAEEATAIGLPPPAELGPADAEAWASDQRRRNVFLDIATMELLGIKYRVSGRANTVAADPASAGGVKRGRDASATAMTPEQLQQLLTKAIPSSYPAVGAPYPMVSRGWAVYLNSARGQYGFKGPTSGPSQPPLFVHPKTRKHYFVSPQAFVQQRKVNLDVVARDAGVETKDVESWMADQRTRSAAIDAAVVRLIPITYSDVDKAMDENAAVEVAEDGATAPPVSSSRDRDHQHQHASSSRHRSEREAHGSKSGRKRRRHEGSGSDASQSDDEKRGKGDESRVRRRRRDKSPRRRGGNGGGGDRRRR